MFTLVIIGLAAGLITSISPCVLPVLPIVLTARAGDRTNHATDDGGDLRSSRSSRSWRPVWVVVGLVVSFCLSTLLGSLVLSALGLPQDLLRDLGIAVLIIIGVTLLVPQAADLVERPFRRLVPRSARAPRGNGVVLGFGLGLLYVPCAGPVLATIAVVGATHHIGWRAVLLTAAFGVGAGIPLLIVALAGAAITTRVSALRRRARGLRMGSGALMLVLAVLLAFNLTDALQRDVTGYPAALQNSVEGGAQARAALRQVTSSAGGTKTRAAAGNLGGACSPGGTALENCGRAPAITGISSWLNTSGDRPLSLASLRGKVVLIDFWTYSCINCQRTLPHVESWYRDYARAGLVVIGVHTPEFAFEHVRSNVADQAAALGVKYPIAIDNDYATWNAYQNEYWPAEYLVDATGVIRHVSFGEGEYGATESLIRQLLRQANPKTTLAPSTDVPTASLDDDQTPETYLGYRYAPLRTTSGLTITGTRPTTYDFPAHLDADRFALAGRWTQDPETLTADADARLELSYLARHVYLVLGGSGSVTASIDGRSTRSIAVSGVPRLYPLASSPASTRHVLTLSASPGVQAYDFTFG
ncbi:cytochrome c biogenesis protein DipZ [uncultured Jatrophihabitans sp.]|uniref:cytochrome c biogenesis protein DipZ n=1 Tax=uncultured Jatrophihabitans sp. TaxID=1610747 RepID=UPI0035CC2CC3